MTPAKCEYCGGYQAKPPDDYKCPNCGAPMQPAQFGITQGGLYGARMVTSICLPNSYGAFDGDCWDYSFGQVPKPVRWR